MNAATQLELNRRASTTSNSGLKPTAVKTTDVKGVWQNLVKPKGKTGGNSLMIKKNQDSDQKGAQENKDDDDNIEIDDENNPSINTL